MEGRVYTQGCIFHMLKNSNKFKIICAHTYTKYTFLEFLQLFLLVFFGVPKTHLDLVYFCQHVCTTYLFKVVCVARLGAAYAFT